MNKPIVLVVGARPNFVKASPLYSTMRERKIDTILLHTGQHYDYELSKKFFEDFALKEADINLEVGSGNHGEQTGRIMLEIEKVLMDIQPSLVAVFGRDAGGDDISRHSLFNTEGEHRKTYYD